MLSKTLEPTLDMIRKMLQNNESNEKILQFVESSYPGIYSQMLFNDIVTCTSCKLCKCNHTPFTGDIKSPIMFVGEAPGEHEERTGIPFVGPAGELFTKMLTNAAEKINPRWARESVYISNTIKCRPVNGKSNRQPEMQEIASCKPILDKEITIVNPKIIVCVGATAANTLIHPSFKITEEHGRIFGDTMKMVAIYHPSFVLHKGEDTDEGIAIKKAMWADLMSINSYLDGI